MLSSMPDQPLASFIIVNLSASSPFRAWSYVAPKTRINVLANNLMHLNIVCPNHVRTIRHQKDLHYALEETVHDSLYDELIISLYLYVILLSCASKSL
jgi:hypothetical protein